MCLSSSQPYILILLVHLFVLYINYMFRPLRVAIFRFSANILEAISMSMSIKLDIEIAFKIFVLNLKMATRKGRNM